MAVLSISIQVEHIRKFGSALSHTVCSAQRVFLGVWSGRRHELLRWSIHEPGKMVSFAPYVNSGKVRFADLNGKQNLSMTKYINGRFVLIL